MPNWCYNSLKVKGDKEKVKEFMSKAILITGEGQDKEVKEISLMALYPTPQRLLDAKCPSDDDAMKANLIGEYGYPNWYSWRLSKWGTKWDLASPALSDSKEDKNKLKVTYTFDTAWSPPINAFEKISKDFPELKFNLKYSEEGMEFCGQVFYKDGITDNVDVDWNSAIGRSIRRSL